MFTVQISQMLAILIKITLRKRKVDDNNNSFNIYLRKNYPSYKPSDYANLTSRVYWLVHMLTFKDALTWCKIRFKGTLPRSTVSTKGALKQLSVSFKGTPRWWHVSFKGAWTRPRELYMLTDIMIEYHDLLSVRFEAGHCESLIAGHMNAVDRLSPCHALLYWANGHKWKRILHVLLFGNESWMDMEQIHRMLGA